MPVSRFSITIPTNSLEKSHKFYSQVVGCQEIERGLHHVRYSFFSHELVVCYIDDSFVPQEHCNHVDQHDVPVPHFGIVLREEEFHQLSKRLTEDGIKFIINPHLRFPGLVGEQWTMFFKDPSGNNLEFKAMTNPSYLFAS